jgi:pimeloyl-ACP methyl ester carboxylesterase
MKHVIYLSLFTVFFCSCAAQKTTVPLWKTLPDLPPLPVADDSGFATVNDIKLYYAVFNKNGDKPVLLLHGGLVSSDYWSFQVPSIAKTHKVIVVDSRGHGRSSMSQQPLSYELMASDIIGLMDYLKLDRTSVVGWSDGGIIGMLLAIQHPDRMDKLFTFGSNYNRSGYKSEPGDSIMAKRFMSQVQENYRRLSPTPEGFFKLRSALTKMYGVEPDLKPEDLKKIQEPTIIACGEYEQFIKREHFEELARIIPNAKLVVIPNVGHGGPVQDPAKFNRAVIKFLDRK